MCCTDGTVSWRICMSLFCMQTTCALEGCGQAGLLTADLARLQYHGTNALLLLHDSSSNCDGIFTPQHCGTGFAYSVHVHVLFSMHAIMESSSLVRTKHDIVEVSLWIRTRVHAYVHVRVRSWVGTTTACTIPRTVACACTAHVQAHEDCVFFKFLDWYCD